MICCAAQQPQQIFPILRKSPPDARLDVISYSDFAQAILRRGSLDIAFEKGERYIYT
jgi:hypothetical protein